MNPKSHEFNSGDDNTPDEPDGDEDSFEGEPEMPLGGSPQVSIPPELDF